MTRGQIVILENERRPQRAVREVYFIRARSLGLIKIGVSDNSRRRLKQLAEIIPDDLELMGVEYCHQGGALERQLHERFSILRERGEWFRQTPGLLQYIKLNATWPMPAARLKGLNAQ